MIVATLEGEFLEEYPKNYCPACEFTLDHGDRVNCDKCPVDEWYCSGWTRTCERVNSPYPKWKKANPEDRSFWADTVVELVIASIENILHD